MDPLLHSALVRQHQADLAREAEADRRARLARANGDAHHPARDALAAARSTIGAMLVALGSRIQPARPHPGVAAQVVGALPLSLRNPADALYNATLVYWHAPDDDGASTIRGRSYMALVWCCDNVVLSEARV